MVNIDIILFVTEKETYLFFDAHVTCRYHNYVKYSLLYWLQSASAIRRSWQCDCLKDSEMKDIFLCRFELFKAMVLNFCSADEQPVWGCSINKLPILYSLSLAHVSSFGILKQYLQPGYDSPAWNTNTCNVSPSLKMLFRSVYNFNTPLSCHPPPHSQHGDTNDKPKIKKFLLMSLSY